MNKYIAPELEVYEIKNNDVIATSNDILEGDENVGSDGGLLD